MKGSSGVTEADSAYANSVGTVWVTNVDVQSVYQGTQTEHVIYLPLNDLIRIENQGYAFVPVLSFTFSSNLVLQIPG